MFRKENVDGRDGLIHRKKDGGRQRKRKREGQ